MDKWDYLRSPIMKKKSFLVLTSGNFLEALGSRIGTGSISCLSFSLSNRVGYNTKIYSKMLISQMILTRIAENRSTIASTIYF
jgi:hypothetical protein